MKFFNKKLFNVFIDKDAKISNPLFFLFLFIIICLCSAVHAFTIPVFLGQKFLFFLYSFLQATIITSILCYIDSLIKKKFLHNLYISAVFLMGLVFLAQFVALRIMDATLPHLLQIFFSISIENLLIVFRATNLNHETLILIFLSLLLIPIMGILIYFFTKKASKFFLKKSFTLFPLIIFASASLMLLLGIDLSSNIAYQRSAFFRHRKRFPIATTILPQKRYVLHLDSPFQSLRKEEDLLKKLEKTPLICERKPNIFLFIIESLREDSITEKTAPNLYALKNNNIAPKKAFSNADFSNCSWYCIFHSNFPYYWDVASKRNKKGSIPLHMLKKMGYKIHLFSSAELAYFQMNRLLFGEKKELVDQYLEFSSIEHKEAYQRDQLAFNALDKTLKQTEGEGNVFIVFLDSTHSEYSFPSEKAVFHPIVDHINYVKMSYSSDDIPLMKNRYYNSIHFLDTHFGNLFSSQKNKFEDALIVITADHGEEFLEDGSLFHTTHLNKYQTNVPLYFHLPLSLKNNFKTSTSLCSHMDIFPTIFHVLLNKEENFSKFFDGRSIFGNNMRNYILSVNQNAGNYPYEFSIYNGSYRMIGKMQNIKNMKMPNDIEFASIKDNNETELLDNSKKDFINDIINQHFLPTFESITIP